jgi:hypothetical protein
MRVFTREAYEKMNPESTGMEFASEMIMRAGAEDLVIKELPITYHEREGEANLESLPDGWRHVKFMLVNAPGYLFSGPGICLAALGVVMMVAVLTGVNVSGVTLGTNSLIAGGLFTIVGAQVACFGAVATVAAEPIKQARDRVTRLLVDRANLEIGMTAGLVLSGVGATYVAFVGWQWVANGFDPVPVAGSNVLAFVALVLGLQFVFTSFLLSVLKEGRYRE